MPEYDIIRWDERTFDVSRWRYTEEAIAAKKYAFVSDVARLHALHEFGGVYLDTDVEVRRPLDSLLCNDVVLGFEEGCFVATSTMLARPHSNFVGEFLRSYEERSFTSAGKEDLTTNVEVLTSMLVARGLKRNGEPQVLELAGETVRILDRVALSPIDYPNGIDHTSHETFAVHYFGQSWASPRGKARSWLRKLVIRILGGARVKAVRQIFATLSEGRE